jgi:hypothetical protein
MEAASHAKRPPFNTTLCQARNAIGFRHETWHEQSVIAHGEEESMYRRSALSLVGLSLAAAAAFAANWMDVEGTEWAYDPTNARVVPGEPIERTGDRIVIDIRRQSDETLGTLKLDCTAREYSIWMLGVTQVDQPTAENPFAARLADEFCPRIDTLPQAGLLHPADAQ